MTARISEFVGAYRFLSNFYPCPVFYDGLIWPTAEHAYQAAKTEDIMSIYHVLNAKSPSTAKRLGRTLPLRPEWENIKLSIMDIVLRSKFDPETKMAQKLDQTGDLYLVEGNRWGDRYWGTDLTGRGENHLGQIIMKIRLDNRTKGL